MKTKEIIKNLSEVEGQLDCVVTCMETISSEDYEYMKETFKAARKALKRLQKKNKKLKKENKKLLIKHREEHKYEEEFAGPAMG